MPPLTFADIEADFVKRVSRIAWATVATVNAAGRPHSRILHPIWEGPVGWIATGRQSPKAVDLDQNPYISVSYWDQEHQQIYAECRTAWEEDQGERSRIWNLFKSTPPPLGYDPGAFFKGDHDPGYGLLKLTPWRIELSSLNDLITGTPPQVWRP